MRYKVYFNKKCQVVDKHNQILFTVTDKDVSYKSVGLMDQAILLKAKELIEGKKIEVINDPSHFSLDYPKEVGGFLLNDLFHYNNDQYIAHLEYVSLEINMFTRCFYRDGFYRVILIGYTKDGKAKNGLPKFEDVKTEEEARSTMLKWIKKYKIKSLL